MLKRKASTKRNRKINPELIQNSTLKSISDFSLPVEILHKYFSIIGRIEFNNNRYIFITRDPDINLQFTEDDVKVIKTPPRSNIQIIELK